MTTLNTNSLATETTVVAPDGLVHFKLVPASSPLQSLAKYCRTVKHALMGVAVALGVAACGGGDGATSSPPVALPAISAFTATPPVVALGQSSVLNWTATGATTITLDDAVVTGQASTALPAATKTYVLLASNTAGTASATVTVAVNRPRGLVVDTVKVAAESVVSDSPILPAPTVRLYFAGINDVRAVGNTFQVQFILSDGQWAMGSNPERALRLEDGVSGVVGNQVTTSPSFKGYEYRVTRVGLSADFRTLFFTIAGIQSAQALQLEPLITLNASTNTLNGVPGVNVAANSLSVIGFKTLAAGGAGPGARTIKVAYRHYVAQINPDALATDANATPDQHTRFPSVLSADLMEFVTSAAKP